jgi:hypothetical protein
MHGAIPPLPNTPSWHGAQLKHEEDFTLTITQRSGWVEVLLEEKCTVDNTSVSSSSSSMMMKKK